MKKVKIQTVTINNKNFKYIKVKKKITNETPMGKMEIDREFSHQHITRLERENFKSEDKVEEIDNSVKKK